MKKFTTIFCILLLLCMVSQGNTVVAQEVETIRVAFLPEMFGFYKIDENGDYSGYNYEYLMNVAQHTDWTYEFVVIEEGSVTLSLKKAEEMVQAGEIDLLGPFSVTTSTFDNFESGSRNYGVYRYNLYSARNKYAITSDNYFLQDVLRVALVEAYSDLNTTFLHLMEATGIDLDITYVETIAQSHEFLFDEKVDTILNLDMSSSAENLDFLTTIECSSFYFVSTKGNTELIAELDEAIRRIEIVEPDIHQILLEKYFGTRYDGEFMFTDEETRQLSKLDSFKVGLLSDAPPYQYNDENGKNVGIFVDILESFEEIIGIPFEILWFDSEDLLITAMESEEIDLIGTVPTDYSLAHSLSVTLTNPIISSSAYWLRSVNEVENPEILFHFVSSNIPFYSNNHLNTTDNIEKALEDMNNEGTVSVFCDPHITAYYMGLHDYANIEVQAVTDVLSEISMGVGGHIDVNLVGMLNRAILYIDSYEVDESIFKHTSVKAEYTLLDILRDNAYKINFCLLIIAAVVVFSVRKNSLKFRDLSRRDSLTKLFNAGYFHEYAEEKSKSLSNGALILIDIDYFKEVNDHHGHHAGDDVIREVAKNMKQLSKENGFHARLGGDEFAILVDGTVDKEQLESQAQALLDAMAKNETGIPVTLSIGGFIFDKPKEYRELYKKADKVLYEVKENGRNNFLMLHNVEPVS